MHNYDATPAVCPSCNRALRPDEIVGSCMHTSDGHHRRVVKRLNETVPECKTLPLLQWLCVLPPFHAALPQLQGRFLCAVLPVFKGATEDTERFPWIKNMSHVTDILLLTALHDGGRDDEHPNADALSAWLVEHHGPACSLKQLDQHADGNKRMQADVFGVALQSCNIGALVSQFRAIPWESPESVQLLLKDECWDAFIIYSVIPP